MRSDWKSDRILLAHIGECVARIREYTGNERATFFGSQLVQDAVLRNLQMLAESTQRLSAPLKATEQNIPWREIAGFRNVLAHDYLGLDMEAAWVVVERELDDLTEAVERMIRIVEGDVSS